MFFDSCLRDAYHDSPQYAGEQEDTKRLGLAYLTNPNHILVEISFLLELYLSAGLFDSLLQVLSLVL